MLFLGFVNLYVIDYVVTVDWNLENTRAINQSNQNINKYFILLESSSLDFLFI